MRISHGDRERRFGSLLDADTRLLLSSGALRIHRGLHGRRPPEARSIVCQVHRVHHPLARGPLRSRRRGTCISSCDWLLLRRYRGLFIDRRTTLRSVAAERSQRITGVVDRLQSGRLGTDLARSARSSSPWGAPVLLRGRFRVCDMSLDGDRHAHVKKRTISLISSACRRLRGDICMLSVSTR